MAKITVSGVKHAIKKTKKGDVVVDHPPSAKAGKNDVFLGITTSGRSPNIIEALKVCAEKGIPSILLTGHDGGEAKLYADYTLIVPGKYTSTIQEMHIMVYHTLCECVEKAIFFEKNLVLENEMN